MDELLAISDRVKQGLGDGAAVVLGAAADGKALLVGQPRARGGRRRPVGRGASSARWPRSWAAGAAARRRWRAPAARTRRARRGARRRPGAPDDGPGGVKVLALDHGSARTGVAVSDPTGTIARPLPADRAASTRRPGAGELDAVIATEAAARASWWASRGRCRASGAPRRAAAAGFAGRLRARVDVPVELWDERLTTVEAVAPRPRGRLAGRPRQPRGLRAAGGLPGGAAVSRPRGRGYSVHGRRERGRARPRRSLWLVVIVVMVAAAALALAAPFGRRRRPAAAARPRCPRSELLIREGLRREDVARAPRRGDADPGRALPRARPPRARAAARWRGRDRPTSLEGFLFPATYEITEDTTAAELVDLQLARLRGQHRRHPATRYAAARNLTRFDVLTIASMIEREVAVPSRAPARGARDLQPPAGRDAARHRRDGAVRDRGVEDRADGDRPRDRLALQHTPLHAVCRPARSRAPAPTASGPPRARRRPTSSTTWRATTAPGATTSRPTPEQFEQDVPALAGQPAVTIDGRTRVAGIIGWPVEHSLSPAMHNAAFAALGLNWIYAAFPVASGPGPRGGARAWRPPVARASTSRSPTSRR